ncbi:acetylornithine/N-succinyldiaminopimelate aminotransferase [Rhodoblastus acidophilus]|uniref:Acetylornithine aminotransferase n=1 Tax=Rhodoblastus acidophilus TaxID=1074 RepID=A0A212RX21_RHOAC|nr:aspartate aminotransferase family protein [Rhodoblastus acidophilus]MCW2315226.1 acetylornithine/N-succinyldiaminopimelate aminotransferase [Rhodoblastus acidophilus]PPQ38453.1 aspartate aminotransferase family protein [Rhodoblastus acidophilus]RAI17073.1 aspartate aminotransferase family protein [Rhodoblastus acidophilus]SNB77258.1 acetylornithine/N-succinyldiaminopimelate aminotransferase [Rhodoblastus acidophilus]
MTSALLPTYARYDLAFERGEGAWLVSTEGEKYLDFGGGIAVACLGYNHPHLVEALTQQARKLWHTSNLFQAPEGERLARRLCQATFADRVFFTNSGAEALELTIKMARKWNAANGHPARFHMITFEGAFHGRTLATIAAGGNRKYLDGFGERTPGFDQVPFGDLAAVEKAIGPETGAILVEPIQGEGGIRVGERDFVRGLRALCDHHKLMLCFDEVQSGMGRTGKLFAYEHYGVAPDIMASAKGIGGGFPLGAVLATEEAAKGMTVGTHGTTYGGNPLAMACGNAVLDVMLADGFLEEVGRKGLALRQQLAGLAAAYPDIVTEIRGEGLMQGLQLTVAPADFAAAARAARLIVIPAADHVVRILPPLIVGDEEIKIGVDRLAEACAAMKAAKEPEKV